MIANRVGIIDIGTNTFNLLIVDRLEDGFKKVFNTKVGVGLGLGGINEGILAADAMSRGLEALEGFLQDCERLKVSSVKAFATSAVRDASNKEEFLQLIDQKMGLLVEVISGSREAELIYQGVKLGYKFVNDALIMDIGGGSTEFIYANKDEVVKSKSFNIGTARIYQLFDFDDPYSKENVETIVQYLEDNTQGFFEDVQVEVLIGASGSFETFYALINEKEYPEDEFEDMRAADVIEVLDEMIGSTMDERMKNPFIIPIRKKMAPIAAVKIKWILEKLKINTLTISPFAMKEGVIQLI